MSNPVQLPKFNFNKATIKSTEELTQRLDADSKEDKYFRPGRHAVTISNVVYQGLAGDKNWGNFLVTVKGVGKRELTEQIKVPLYDVEYRNPETGKTNMFLFKRFASFMAALGETELKVETLAETLDRYFSKPEKALVGRQLDIEIGYNGVHVAYDGKTADGGKRYVFKTRTGEVVNETVYPDFDAALADCENVGTEDRPQYMLNVKGTMRRIERFTSITQFYAIASKAATGSGW